MERQPGIETTGLAEAWHTELLQRPNFSEQPYDVDAVDEAYKRLIIMPGSQPLNQIIGRASGLLVDRLMIQLGPGEKGIEDLSVVATYKHNREWWNRFGITRYNSNPFRREATETLAIGKDSPEVMVYNFGPELKDEHVASLNDAYTWFESNGLRPSESTVVIGNHLGLRYDYVGATRDIGEIGGECTRRQNIISINQAILLDGELTTKFMQRYSALVEKGVNVADVVMTHELAHAFANEKERHAEVFSNRAGWEQREYKVRVPEDYRKALQDTRTLKFGRRTVKSTHVIEGLGNTVNEEPVTSYGWYNADEDFAESMVFYRFAPELLGITRRTAMYAMINSLKGSDWSRAEPTRIERLPAPVYPRFKPADLVVYRTKTHKEKIREQQFQEITSMLFGYADVMSRNKAMRARSTRAQ